MLRGVKGKISVQWPQLLTWLTPLPHTPTCCYIMVNPIYRNDGISDPKLCVFVPHNSGNAHAHLCGKRSSKSLCFSSLSSGSVPYKFDRGAASILFLGDNTLVKVSPV